MEGGEFWFRRRAAAGRWGRVERKRGGVHFLGGEEEALKQEPNESRRWIRAVRRSMNGRWAPRRKLFLGHHVLRPVSASRAKQALYDWP